MAKIGVLQISDQGSIPCSSTNNRMNKFKQLFSKCLGGGIGRHEGLKIPCLYWRVGSSPTLGTKCRYGGMVDTAVLETVLERGVGSSPTICTKVKVMKYPEQLEPSLRWSLSKKKAFRFSSKGDRKIYNRIFRRKLKNNPNFDIKLIKKRLGYEY